MSIEGKTGAGKSTLVRAYARAFSPDHTTYNAYVPVFYVQIPAPATVKGLASAMLSQLGDPAAHRGTLWSMNGRLISLIKACQVELVILDDFHHLIDAETDRVLATVSDWLKTLVKSTEIPFLVIGIEGKNERILRANSQLSRLFAVRETLEPFAWDLGDPDTIKQFALLINYVEQTVGYDFTDKLPQTELLYRLHYATDGVMANVINLSNFAAILAEEQKSETITLGILYQAFSKRLARHLYQKQNPFDPAIGDHFIALGETLINHPNAVGRRSQRRKKEPKLPSISETLSTK